MGEQRNRECWPSPQDALDLNGHTVPQVVPRKAASPSSLAQGMPETAKPQAVLMSCTAVPPEDTRGQEALT